MPRPKSRVPALTLHRPSGQARCRWQGKDHYFGPFGEPESDAKFRRWAAELLTAGAAPTAAPPRTAAPRPAAGGLTITELVAAYRRHCLDYYRDADGAPTTEVDCVKQSVRPVRALFGDTPAADFGPKRLKTVRDEMVRAGLCRNEVNKRVGRVKRMFRWGVSEELLPATARHALEAVEGLKRGRTPARETDPVLPAPDADVEAALRFLPGPVAAVVRLQRLTGMRPGEVVALRPGDLTRADDVWEYRPRRHKTQYRGRTRVVMIGPRGRAALAPYLDRPADRPCFSPIESVAEVRARRRAARTTPESHGNRPGTNRRRRPAKPPGEAYTVATYRQAIYRACKEAGVPNWSPNRLRHSLATEVRRTHGLEAAQVTLGHSRADVTQVYAERDAGLARRVMAEAG